MYKIFTKKLSIVFVLLGIGISAIAQKEVKKFGKIETTDLSETTCPIDSNAYAYFIFDYGNSDFEYGSTIVRSDDPSSGSKGFQLMFNRHYRIKVLSNQGLDAANIEIPLYHDGENAEKIVSFKAYTYNLVGSKIEKSKVSLGDMLSERSSDNWTTQKVAMPNVKEGSVIEVEYTIQSDFIFNLRSWAFQYYFPVVYSEYHTVIPEYFTYNKTQLGFFPLETQSKTNRKEIKLTYIQRAEGIGQEAYKSEQTIAYQETTSDYIARNIPALKNPGFLRTVDNYRSKIDFELQSTNFPNTPMRTYGTTWENICSNLLEHPDFGKNMEAGSFMDDAIASLKRSGTTDEALLQKTLGFAKNKYVWNGQNTKYTSESLSKIYKNGGGNCADINLSLVALLNGLGFETYPVVLSTQANGIIPPTHPSLSGFDYVIAAVKLNAKVYLLDATDPNSEVNLLPIRCLNDKGFLVNKRGGEWINLMDYKPFSTTEMFSLEISKDLSMKGSMKKKLKDYAAYQEKKAIKDAKTIEG
ncbi:MAG: hypothetical protein RIS47_315, partial [Bacteroidota bacterium]